LITLPAAAVPLEHPAATTVPEQGSLHPPHGAQWPAWLMPADASMTADIVTKLAIHFTVEFL
jgi:hypothetical protein